MSTNTVILAIGSNVGDRKMYLERAVASLEEFGHVSLLSSIFETEPMGNVTQSDFYNMAAEFETDYAPASLMNKLLEIELRLGRERYTKWGPRTIDMDIIFYNDLIMNDSGLKIPHPHYAERNFVLAPISEIVPNKICPIRGVTIKELLDLSPDSHRFQTIGRISETNLV